jgi:hypothetical protein
MLRTLYHQDAAEKAGLLGWADLAHVSFKQSVARKHELGAYASASRNARAAKNSAAAQASSQPGGANPGNGVGTGGTGVEAEAAGAAAAAVLRALTAPTGKALSSGGNSAVSLQDTATGGGDVHRTTSLNSEEGGNGAAAANHVGNGSSNSSVGDWTRQPCPLFLPRGGRIVIQEEDLAITLSRSTHNRGLPNTVLSSARPTGSCLYKHKLGVYALTAAAAAAGATPTSNST